MPFDRALFEVTSAFATVVAHYNPIVTALATMPKPVVAAVNGPAVGWGATMATLCDIVLMSGKR